MTLIETAQAQIDGAKQALEPAAAQVSAAHETCDKVAARSTALGWKPKAERAGQIRDALAELHTVLTDASSTLDEVRGALEELKGLLRGNSTARASPPKASLELSKISPTEGMAGIRPFGEAGTAEGNLFFASGKQNDQPLKATPGETRFRPGEVKTSWRDTKPAQGHIEGNAAADMLHAGQLRAVLFLNAQPCDHKGQGCKDNTVHYLKRGTVLDVRMHDDQGRMRYRRRFTGTGEALADD